MRVFPLSNWTELDVWTYIEAEAIAIVPLYLAAERRVVARHGTLIAVDDQRLRLLAGEDSDVAPHTVSYSGLLAAEWRHLLRTAIGRRRRDRRRRGRAIVGAPGASRRWRVAGFDGAQETRGLLLMSAMPAPAVIDVLPLGLRSELRFLACGSVDDGKSTLIGRLINDATGLFEDQARVARGRSAALRQQRR